MKKRLWHEWIGSVRLQNGGMKHFKIVPADGALVQVNSLTYDVGADELVLRFKLEMPKQKRVARGLQK